MLSGDPTRRVDNRLYTDASVFEREVERIFLKTWLFACHESELRRPGDFLTTTLVDQPLLLVRGRDDIVRAFYNTCRHRGSQVVAEPCGHAASFRCPYHFWVYDLAGDLIGIPGEEAYDGTGFVKDDYPLVAVRCETLLGLVFVTFDDGAESLRSFLGPNVVDVLSTPLANGRFEVQTFKSVELPINWKIFPENARDGYHVPFVHPFFRKASPPGEYELFPNGHAVQWLGMDPAEIDPAVWDAIRQHTLPGVKTGGGYIVTIFPDLFVQLRSNEISIESQRAFGSANVRIENRVLGLEGDTEEIKSMRRLSHRTWVADPLELEDGPVFRAQQAGVAARGVPYSIIARGADATVGTRGDDNRLRQWWERWRAYMGLCENALSAEEIRSR